MFQQGKKVLAGVAALGALALGGAAIADATTSNGSSTTNTTATTPPSNAQAPPKFNGPAPGTAAHEDAEKPVTGATADKVRAAAVKAVGGGTAGEVTTDYTQTGYETTVTKSDGSKVEVHLDRSFHVLQGPGGPGGPHGPGAGGYSAPSGSGMPAGPPPGVYGG